MKFRFADFPAIPSSVSSLANKEFHFIYFSSLQITFVVKGLKMVIYFLWYYVVSALKSKKPSGWRRSIH